jgi:hypothetical protein
VKTLCDEGLKMVIANEQDLASYNAPSQRVINELSKDATTKGFIDQIQQLKENIGPPAAAAPLPEGCAVQSN